MKTISKKLFAENMGRTERYLRMLFGAFLISWVFIWPTDLGWLGLYPFLTGLIGSCPIYRMLGIDRARTLPA